MASPIGAAVSRARCIGDIQISSIVPPTLGDGRHPGRLTMSEIGEVGIVAGQAVGRPIGQAVADQDQFHGSTLVPPSSPKASHRKRSGRPVHGRPLLSAKTTRGEGTLVNLVQLSAPDRPWLSLPIRL